MFVGVGVFLVLLIALLAIPVTMRFRVQWQQGLLEEIWLDWAFGLVRVQIPSTQSKPPAQDKEKPKDRVVERAKPSTGKKGNVLGALRQADFRRRIYRFVKDLWLAVHKENVRLRVRLGLGDPADTGQLWGIVGPLSGILAGVREASITIEPVFVDRTFELDSSGAIRLVPLRIIALSVALILSPPVWRGLKAMRSGVG